MNSIVVHIFFQKKKMLLQELQLKRVFSTSTALNLKQYGKLERDINNTSDEAFDP